MKKLLLLSALLIFACSSDDSNDNNGDSNQTFLERYDGVVWVNDLYEPLVNFWQVLQAEGLSLTDALIEQKVKHPDRESARKLFTEAKELINDHQYTSVERAVAFYIVNKCSFSGLTESSSFSKQASDNNFSFRGIEKLPEYSKIIAKWHITNLTYEELFDESSERHAFVYLDPPYDIKDNLYGKKGAMHKGFDHDRFASDCDSCSMDCLISYNADQLVKDRFKEWNAGEFDLTYTMRSVGEYMRDQKQRKELLLFNYGLKGLAELNQSDQKELA